MKTLLIGLTAFFMVTLAHGQTNVQQPFPDSAFWRVDMHCQYHNCNERYYYNYYFGGDTLLNSSLHIKIMRDSVVLQGIGGPPCMLNPWAHNAGYLGALKQDSIAKKVFLVLPNTTTDTLIYDYNLVVGDTIKGLLANGYTMIVSSIDSIWIGNQYRRKWNFTAPNEGPGYIIQGIGSDNGLIESLNSSGFCFSSLICVIDSAMSLFTSTVSSTYGCQLIQAGLDELKNRKTIYFYPNPFSSSTTLRTDKFLENALLTFYNSFGQAVNQMDKLAGQTIIFQRDNLSSGLYFIRLTQDSKIIATDKLVITDN
jgi:hypothetical protein